MDSKDKTFVTKRIKKAKEELAKYKQAKQDKVDKAKLAHEKRVAYTKRKEEEYEASKVKTCIHCKETKPTSNFYVELASKDGFRGNCKDCRRIYGRRNREAKGLIKSFNREALLSREGKAKAKAYFLATGHRLHTN